MISRICAVAATLLVFSGSMEAQQVHQIEILHANSMEFDKALGVNAQRLLGEVVFKQKDATMYCDSAWYYSNENKVDAFGDIHILQGDTLSLSGRILNYDGNTRVAKMRNNVKLVDKDMVLTSPSLDFNISESIGYYTEGGVITSQENILKSQFGYYYSKQKNFFFKTKVEINNPDYTIYSDTLKYNTQSEIAWFFGPTHIYSKENYIYCENGWYNTKTDISQFSRNSMIKSKDQKITGDSMYYDRNKGFGRAFNNVSIYDSVQRVILKGQKAFYTEHPETALLTERAQMIQISDGDSMFVHADTLRSVTTDSVKMIRVMRAYYHVKIFKEDLQAKCDSLSYNSADSTIYLDGDPVVWSDVHQLTATRIYLLMKNNKPFRISMEDMAFIASQEDSLKFNQIRGKEMLGYFVENQLVKIDVTGNGQTIYYARDGEITVGVNKAESSDLKIYLKNKKVDRILFLSQPTSVLYPLQQAPAEELLLRDFRWLDEHRPRNRDEIFIWHN
ncbi:MAG: OstA-like protein [Bacteroidales bacterium]